MEHAAWRHSRRPAAARLQGQRQADHSVPGRRRHPDAAERAGNDYGGAGTQLPALVSPYRFLQCRPLSKRPGGLEEMCSPLVTRFCLRRMAWSRLRRSWRKAACCSMRSGRGCHSRGNPRMRAELSSLAGQDIRTIEALLLRVSKLECASLFSTPVCCRATHRVSDSLCLHRHALVPGKVAPKGGWTLNRLSRSKYRRGVCNGDGHVHAAGGQGAGLMSEWVCRPGGQSTEAQHQRPHAP